MGVDRTVDPAREAWRAEAHLEVDDLRGMSARAERRRPDYVAGNDGCQWRALQPKGLLPQGQEPTVHNYFTQWSEAWVGTLDRIHHELYGMTRERLEGREATRPRTASGPLTAKA